MRRRELISVGLFLVASAGVLLLPRLVLGERFPRAAVRLRRHLLHRAARPEPADRDYGPDLARPRSVHADRRLHDGDPDVGADPPLELLGHQFTGDMRDIWTIPIAGLVAGIAGFLFGFPALRLTGLYLALATFAVAVALPAMVKKYEGFTGGGGGINLFEATPGPRPRRSRIQSRSKRRESRSVLGIDIPSSTSGSTTSAGRSRSCCSRGPGCSCGAASAARFARSGTASSPPHRSGVNLARYKTLAFGISAFYAGVAGSLLAIATTFVNPDTFPITLSIFLLVGVVVGGLGSLWPLVFGAIFIHFMQIEWAQQAESVVPTSSRFSALSTPTYRARRRSPSVSS